MTEKEIKNEKASKRRRRKKPQKSKFRERQMDKCGMSKMYVHAPSPYSKRALKQFADIQSI